MANQKAVSFFDSALGKAVKAGLYAFSSSLVTFLVVRLQDKTGIVLDETVVLAALVGLANSLIYGTVKVADPKVPNLPS